MANGGGIYQDVIKSYSAISGTNINSSYPASNCANDVASELTVSDSTSCTIVIDRGASPIYSICAVALINHNQESSANITTLQFQTSSDNFLTVDNTYSVKPSFNRENMWHDLGVCVTSRYIRLNVVLVSGVFSIGKFYLGTKKVFDKNNDYDVTEQDFEDANYNENHGQPFVDRVSEYSGFVLNFQNYPAAGISYIREMMKLKPFIYIPDTDEYGCYFVLSQSRFSGRKNWKGNYDFQMSLKEIAVMAE